MKFISLMFVLFIAFTSCKKDEIAIEKHDSGNAIVSQLAMGEDYNNQIYYDLGTNSMVRSNPKTAWDLGFESGVNGWHIVLNSARGMAVHRSNLSFDQLTTDVGLDWHWDVQSGDLDSTAFGDWQNDNLLYVIDLGYSSDGSHLGFKKMQMTDLTGTNYVIQVGDLSNSSGVEVVINKDPETSFTYYSFDNGVVDIAPSKEEWDLLFTQYTHLFYNPDEVYVVSGVLLNRYQTEATLIVGKTFEDVNYDDAIQANFSNLINEIGYSWKWYDYSNSVYLVDPSMVYVVRTSEGLFYKIHFIDFYNETGLKGYPKFEIAAL